MYNITQFDSVNSHENRNYLEIFLLVLGFIVLSSISVQK